MRAKGRTPGGETREEREGKEWRRESEENRVRSEEVCKGNEGVGDGSEVRKSKDGEKKNG